MYFKNQVQLKKFPEKNKHFQNRLQIREKQAWIYQEPLKDLNP